MGFIQPTIIITPPVHNRLANNQTINSQTTLQDIISANFSVGLWDIDIFWGLSGTANTGTRHGFSVTGTTNYIRGYRMRASSMSMVELNSGFNLGLAETTTAAWFKGTFDFATSGSIIVQAAQNTSHGDNLTVNTYTKIIGRPLFT